MAEELSFGKVTKNKQELRDSWETEEEPDRVRQFEETTNPRYQKLLLNKEKPHRNAHFTTQDYLFVFKNSWQYVFFFN